MNDATAAFIDAISGIAELTRLVGIGKPTIQLQFGTVMEEARFYELLCTQMPKDAFRAAELGYRANCQLVVAGCPIRVTSDQRLDEIFRLNFK